MTHGELHTARRRQGNGWYGCRPDTVDRRDVPFRARAIRLPREVDLFEYFPPPGNQDNLGCCTGFGTTWALRWLMRRNGKPDVPLSCLQNYYDSRSLDGTVESDAGAEIRNNIKAAAAFGVARENLWPYDISRFAEKPGGEVYANALNFQALKYERVEIDASCVMTALAQGFPVIIGITLFQSFESEEVERTGVVPFPEQGEVPVGGHCMIVGAYGKPERPGHFKVRNSWSPEWGDRGDCWLPYNYVGSPDFGADYWIIREAELEEVIT